VNSKRVMIVGGGIVGLATAYRLSERFPGARIGVLEKEAGVGRHQTGHNSGVLHCGLYYKPGSVKARLAVTGIRQMVEFCRENAIPHEICGKLVVAVDDAEVARLRALHERGIANGLAGLRWMACWGTGWCPSQYALGPHLPQKAVGLGRVGGRTLVFHYDKAADAVPHSRA
jgi:(S)-2-hydroxyglutarate dehydrogenase